MEDGLLQLAIVQSLDEAKELEAYHPKLGPSFGVQQSSPAKGLRQGDCQYLSVMALAKTQGADLGGVGDLRWKVYHTLTQWPETYSPFVDWVGYQEYTSTVLQPHTWRDNVTLQAMMDAHGFGVRVYYIAPDSETEDSALSWRDHTPSELPEVWLEICHIKDAEPFPLYLCKIRCIWLRFFTVSLKSKSVAWANCAQEWRYDAVVQMKTPSPRR